MEELERSLGDIEIVKGVVRIVSSHGLKSLSFLRNLQVIVPAKEEMLIQGR